MNILYINFCFCDPGISDSEVFQKLGMQTQIKRLIWMHSTPYLLASQTRIQNTTSSVLQLALVKT